MRVKGKKSVKNIILKFFRRNMEYDYRMVDKLMLIVRNLFDIFFGTVKHLYNSEMI